MKKRTSIMAVVLLIVFGGLIVFNILRQIGMQYYFAHFQAPAVTVSSVIATRQDWQPFLSAVGNFVAINGVDINTQSGGKVSAIHFDSGQLVDKDQALIDIDDSVEQATRKYNQADLVLQQVNFQRQVDLFKKNATAQSSVDDAKARLLEAEANLEKIEAEIALKHIKTPFAGILGIRLINLGQYVQPGQTSIVTLQSLDPIYLNFYIPEQYIDTISINQNIQFTVEQSPNIVYQGKITAINAKIDENTHNVQVQATIANCPASDFAANKELPWLQKTKLPKGKLAVHCDTNSNHRHQIDHFNFIPGMFAEIDIHLPVIHDVVVLPTTAISYSMYGNSVFVIHKTAEKKPALTVQRVFVTTGETQGNNTVITSGIQAGQMVVSAGELKLQDGTAVVIDNHLPLVNHSNIDSLGE